MYTGHSVSFRFSGNINKRIKQHHQHRKLQVAQEQKTLYKTALEQYSENPEWVSEFLEKPIYTDQEGPFTGKDLMETLSRRIRNEKIGMGIAIGFCVLTVIPSLIFLDPEMRRFNIDENEFVNKFIEPVRLEVRHALKDMRELGLIEYLEDGKIRGFTKLGKQVLVGNH